MNKSTKSKVVTQFPKDMGMGSGRYVSIKQGEVNYKALEKQDIEARKAKTLVGRYISEPHADGYAVYVITKENGLTSGTVDGKTVCIHVVTGLGDAWQIPYWGTEATIARKYALDSIKRREVMADIFG
jgi:hypothetical protein